MLRNDGPRVLDIEVSTAREWLRVGRELLQLAKTRSAFREGRLSDTKVRSVTAAIDAEVMRGNGRETDPNTDRNATCGEIDASGTRASHVRWSSLGQQRVDSLVRLIGGGGSKVITEVILHVRADGCTLHDGTPIGGSIVERIASEASLRVMIHDAESRPINVSGTHRHHTKRQKLVVPQRASRRRRRWQMRSQVPQALSAASAMTAS